MNRRARDGFTLVELLIVTVILGVLAAIGIPRYNQMRARSFMTTVASDLRNLAHQQEIYYNTQYTFASDLSELGGVESEGVTITINEADRDGWAATATHAGIPAEQCGIYHGAAAAAGGAPAATQSLVQCSR